MGGEGRAGAAGGPSPEAPPTLPARAALWCLLAGNFAAGTGALVVAGVLGVMADDLAQPAARIGHLITTFALAVAIGGPLLATLTSRLDRRRLLRAGLMLLALGSTMCAFADGLGSLLLGRAVAGVGACLFTPHAGGTAALLAGEARRGRAIGFVFTGFSAAMVLGVPLGAVVAEQAGWRWAFGLAAMLALAVCWPLWRSLPGGLHVPALDAAAWKRVTRHPVLVPALAVTALQQAGQFALFTYLAVALKLSLGVDAAGTGGLLAAFGIAGVLGNLIAARAMDRSGAGRMASGVITLCAAAVATWPLAAGSFGATLALMMAWGAGSFAVNSAQQSRLVAAEPALASASLPLNSLSIYLGQAAGASLGGWVLLSVGAQALWAAAALLMLASAALSVWIGTREARRQGPR